MYFYFNPFSVQSRFTMFHYTSMHTHNTGNVANPPQLHTQPVKQDYKFNSAKNIFAFSSPPQMRRRAKLFVSCCRPYLVHQYTILPFPN